MMVAKCHRGALSDVILGGPRHPSGSRPLQSMLESPRVFQRLHALELVDACRSRGYPVDVAELAVDVVEVGGRELEPRTIALHEFPEKQHIPGSGRARLEASTDKWGVAGCDGTWRAPSHTKRSDFGSSSIRSTAADSESGWVRESSSAACSNASSGALLRRK